MPLDITKLTLDPGLPGAQDADYPATRQAAAAAWAAAVAAYAETVAPPLLQPVLPAQEALEATLLDAFGRPAVSVADALEASFMMFGATVALLMAPLPPGIPIWVPVPPPGLVGFQSLFDQRPYPTTRAAGVLRLATRIDAWMRTGTATLALPPNTATTWL